MNVEPLKKNLHSLAFILLLAGLSICLLNVCNTFGRIMNLKMDAGNTDAFRKQELSKEALKSLEETGQELNLSEGTLLAVWMPVKQFKLSGGDTLDADEFLKWESYLSKYRSRELENLSSLYQAIWDDLVYFPTEPEISYEDSWMFERTYGGKRGHEGCDLMPPRNQSGIYPIFSMTEGVVEKIGWLDKGGFRIGIRSPHGGYFYYAHLSDYGSDFQEGQAVQAGELIGYMGDTGYGPEGTRGKFDVHLHLGIYVRTPENPEVSVNPYWILQSLEGHKLKYRY